MRFAFWGILGAVILATAVHVFLRQNQCEKCTHEEEVGRSSMELPHSFPNAQSLPPTIASQLRTAFGHRDPALLSAAGVWPPFQVTYDLNSLTQPLSVKRTFEFDYIPQERVSRYGKTMLTLSLKPRVEYFPNLISKQETADLLALSKLCAKNKTFIYGFRTGGSGIGDLPPKNPAIVALDNRILGIVGLNASQPTFAMHYHPEHYYAPHHDAHSFSEDGKGWRTATLILYLTDVAGGGFTNLPAANGEISSLGISTQPGLQARKEWQSREATEKACLEGLRVRPVAGSAVLFYNMLQNGSRDEHALHCACPNGPHDRWVISKWIHYKCDHKNGPKECAENFD